MDVCAEGHILEDVNKCILALQQRDADMYDRTAGAIRGRCSRLCNVVAAEMFNYEPGPYTDRVMETVMELRDHSELFSCCCNYYYDDYDHDHYYYYYY